MERKDMAYLQIVEIAFGMPSTAQLTYLKKQNSISLVYSQIHTDAQLGEN
jgi:hypothetical protein